MAQIVLSTTNLINIEEITYKYTITFHQQAEDGYGMIDTDSLKKMQDTGAALTVVDAKNPGEYQEMHLQGAINIPDKKFSEKSNQLPADKSVKIIFYCNSGGRSYNTCRKLMELSYQDINQALFADWKEAGLPIDRS